MFELKGALKELKEERQVSDNFKVREFVLTDDSTEYPQHIQMQTTQDRCDKLNGLKVGDRILVKFNIRGREWFNPQGEVKYFNSLDAWAIQKEEGGIGHNPQPVDINQGGKEDDPLPF
jgi:hypothetical protein